jgi:peptidylprolyl isomerase
LPTDTTIRRAFRLAAAFTVVLALAPGAPAAQKAKDDKAKDTTKEKKMTETESGLKYRDEKVGEGDSPQTGQTCVMHYTGWLWKDGKKGAKFDSSVDRGEPFEFKIGRGQVIGGWDEGVATMKPGGKRELLIPPDLGYGARGAGGVIPPNATLLFEVELIKVK